MSDYIGNYFSLIQCYIVYLGLFDVDTYTNAHDKLQSTMYDCTYMYIKMCVEIKSPTLECEFVHLGTYRYPYVRAYARVNLRHGFDTWCGV